MEFLRHLGKIVFSGRPGLRNDFQRDAPSQFRAHRSHDSADRFDHLPLATDDFPKVAGMDAQFKHNDLFTLDRANLNLFGVVHKRLYNRFY